MKLKLIRVAKRNDYTIGKLYIDDRQFCDTLEDTDRSLLATMPLDEIRRKKIYGRTAIPYGTYQVRTDIVSPLYSKKDFYRQFCGARMPRIMNVPGWDGVLIHPGNTPEDTLGCILVGVNNQTGRVNRSRDIWQQLYRQLVAASARGESITLCVREKE